MLDDDAQGCNRSKKTTTPDDRTSLENVIDGSRASNGDERADALRAQKRAKWLENLSFLDSLAVRMLLSADFS
jgi:hypothetical protein